MWFLIIAPQRKRQKAHDKMLSELKNGDEIVTSGGVYCTITNEITETNMEGGEDGVELRMLLKDWGTR